MAKVVIENLDQITPEWLTSVLKRSGALEVGGVDGLEILDKKERELSMNVHLRLNYVDGSTGALPARLFLKIVNTVVDDETLLTTEVDYYTHDYLGVEGAPIARCYDAAVSVDETRYHILIEDLSETHIDTYKKPITMEHGLAFAEVLATLHAHWWGAECLEAGGKSIHGSEMIEQYVQISRPGLEHILSSCHDELDPQWPQEMLELYEHHPPLLIERTRNLNGFTLIHGDVSPANILVPIDGERPVYIIDRAPFDWCLTTWLGVYDLTYAIVNFWEVETRRELERPILKQYHASLIERGIKNYSWEQLYEDYRLTTVMSVYMAAEWCSGSGKQYKDFWMPMLQKALTACDDLECAKLWEDR